MILTRSRFVEDLIPCILESSEHFWTRDYIRLARVSRAWLGPIRKLLYKRPELSTFKSCTLLARTLAGNPSLTPLICELVLHPSISNFSEGTRVTPADTAALRRLLAIPNLNELSLGGDLATRAERFLMSLSSPHTITRLTIDGSPDYCGVSMRGPNGHASLEWDASLAVRFRNLKHLQLTDLELEIVPPAARCSIPLEELRLDRVTLTGGFLERLAVGAWSRLRKLHVTARSAVEYDQQIRLLLRACAGTVEEVEYVNERHDLGDEGIFEFIGMEGSAILSFPSMRTMKLSGVHMTPEMLADVSRRCSALNELAVQGRNVLVTSNEWVELVQNGSWPSLKKLSVPGATGPPFAFWLNSMGDPIREACKKRRIEVTCDDISGQRPEGAFFLTSRRPVMTVDHSSYLNS
jgi:hypothetical protein